MAKKKIEVVLLSTYKHKGENHAPGTRISLPPKEAEELIGLGFAMDPGEFLPDQPDRGADLKAVEKLNRELEEELATAQDRITELELLLEETLPEGDTGDDQAGDDRAGDVKGK